MLEDCSLCRTGKCAEMAGLEWSIRVSYVQYDESDGNEVEAMFDLASDEGVVVLTSINTVYGGL